MFRMVGWVYVCVWIRLMFRLMGGVLIGGCVCMDSV